MAKSTEETAVETRQFVPVSMPHKVRRLVTSAPHGARVEVLREGMVYDGFIAKSTGDTLSRVRQLVQQSVAKDGHATFTVCIDDHEESLTSDAYGDEGATLTPSSEADRRLVAYAARMEAVAFRALNQCNAQQAVTTNAVNEIGKAIRQLGKSVKAMAKRSRDMGDPPEVTEKAMELEAFSEQLGFAKEVLPMFTGKARKDKDGNPVMPTFVKAVWALATEEDKKRVLGTDEGVVFRNAPDDRTARVALRALWSLVKSGELKISDALAQKGTALFNGEA